MLIPDKNAKSKKASYNPQLYGKPQLTKDEVQSLKEKITDNPEITFYVRATQDLKDLIVKGEHPIVSQLPDFVQAVFLEGNGLLIDNKMLLSWLEGRLDYRNSFMLNNCEVRVMGQGGYVIGNEKKGIIE